MAALPAEVTVTKPLILVASPSPDEHRMYADCLALFGFRVATATRGDEAIAKARALNPAVVVASVQLPVQDGIEVCRALSELNIPVVLLASVPFYRTVSCAALLLRPALPEDVVATVERVLDPQR